MARWQRTLYITFAAQLFTAVGFSIVFPFLPLYVQSLGTRTGLSIEFWAGMVFSAQAVTMMLASPVWGALADRHGRKLMVERAMLGGAVILSLMAFARSAEELVVLRLIQGLITGSVSATNALVAAEVPRNRMGFAMGLLQVSVWSGVAVGPLIGGVLADTLGFRAPFLLTASLLAISGLVVLVGVEETFEPAPDTGAGYLGFLTEWRRILGSPGVLGTYAVRFLTWLGRSMIVPIVPLFVAALLPEDAPVGTVTGLVVAVASAAGIVSAIYLGRLGDRVGHRRVLIASAFMAAMFYFPQSLVTAAWQLVVLQALTGAAIGGVIPTLSALLARYTRPGEEGAVYGLDNSTVSAARAVAPLAGASIAVWFGLRGAFVAAGLIFLVNTLLAFWRLPES